MKLDADIPSVIGDFNDLDEISLWIDAADTQTCVFECFAVVVVKFEAMAMALIDHLLAIGMVTEAVFSELARAGA